MMHARSIAEAELVNVMQHYAIKTKQKQIKSD